MKTILRAAGMVTPPYRSKVDRLSASTTTAFLDLHTTLTEPEKNAATPKARTGRFLAIKATGGAAYVALSETNTGSLDTSTTGAQVADGCWPINDGETLEITVPGGENTTHRYLAYRTASGTANLHVRISSPHGLLCAPDYHVDPRRSRRRLAPCRCRHRCGSISAI